MMKGGNQMFNGRTWSAILILVLFASLGRLFTLGFGYSVNPTTLFLTATVGVMLWFLVGMLLIERPLGELVESRAVHRVLEPIGMIVGALLCVGFLMMLVCLVTPTNMTDATLVKYQQRLLGWYVIQLAVTVAFVIGYFLFFSRRRVKDGIIVQRAGRVVYPGETIGLFPWFTPLITSVNCRKMAVGFPVVLAVDTEVIPARMLVTIQLDFVEARRLGIRSFDQTGFLLAAAVEIKSQVCGSSGRTTFEQIGQCARHIIPLSAGGFPFHWDGKFSLTTGTEIQAG
ncbi:MAG: hypothetical protein WC734_04595 [Patescibacteria group bacterium]